MKLDIDLSQTAEEVKTEQGTWNLIPDKTLTWVDITVECNQFTDDEGVGETQQGVKYVNLMCKIAGEKYAGRTLFYRLFLPEACQSVAIDEKTGKRIARDAKNMTRILMASGKSNLVSSTMDFDGCRCPIEIGVYEGKNCINYWLCPVNENDVKAKKIPSYPMQSHPIPKAVSFQGAPKDDTAYGHRSWDKAPASDDDIPF